MSSVFTGGQSSSLLPGRRPQSRKKNHARGGGGSNNSRDNPTGAAVINDGRWMPQDTDPLTARHGGKADVTFADFHVEPETSEFGDDITNSEPDL